MADYPYASGNPLEERNTYSYTKYHGKPFLDVWLQERNSIIPLLGIATELPIPSVQIEAENLEKQIVNGETVKTQNLFETLYSTLSKQDSFSKELKKLIDRVMKKFEVTKRIHSAYGPEFKAVDKQAYNDMELYVYAAFVFEMSYKKMRKITYLNVFLKIMDTLCALKDQLNRKQKSYLSRLLNQERKHIQELAESVGVEL